MTFLLGSGARPDSGSGSGSGEPYAEGLARLLASRRTRRRRRLSLSLIGLLLAIGLFGPLFAPYPPDQISLTASSVPPFPPSAIHWFGTDQLGRDLLSRMLYGLRTSMLIALAIRVLTMLVGIIVGLAAASSPKLVDRFLMRLADIFLALPQLLVALTITAILGPSLTTVTIAVSVIGWPDVARLVSAETRRIQPLDFIQAATATGATNWYVVTRHIVPALVPQLAVALSVGFPGAIMYEAGLSFFGLGVQPPDASLGTLIASGRSYVYQAPWMLVIPIAVMATVIIGLNLAADGLVPPDPRRRNRLL